MSFGGNRYPQTDSVVIIGSKTTAGVRTGVELESSYSTTEDTEPTKSFKTAGFEKISLACLYTTGAGETANTVEIKFEQSPDRTNWYPISNVDTTAGSSTIYNREFVFDNNGAGTAAATSYSFEIFLDIAYEHVRVSGKESGVATNKGNLFVEATLVGA